MATLQKIYSQHLPKNLFSTLWHDIGIFVKMNLKARPFYVQNMFSVIRKGYFYLGLVFKFKYPVIEVEKRLKATCQEMKQKTQFEAKISIFILCFEQSYFPPDSESIWNPDKNFEKNKQTVFVRPCWQRSRQFFKICVCEMWQMSFWRLMNNWSSEHRIESYFVNLKSILALLYNKGHNILV